jgi:hypothetical protein
VGHVLHREWRLKPSSPSDHDHSYHPRLGLTIGKPYHHLGLVLPGQESTCDFLRQNRVINSVTGKINE